VADGANTGRMLADVAAGCSAMFGGWSPGCSGEGAGLECTVDSGVCVVVGNEKGLADCWAFALNVSSNEVVIAMRKIPIAQPRFLIDVRRAL